jgi:hypothetical protein
MYVAKLLPTLATEVARICTEAGILSPAFFLCSN